MAKCRRTPGPSPDPAARPRLPTRLPDPAARPHRPTFVGAPSRRARSPDLVADPVTRLRRRTSPPDPLPDPRPASPPRTGLPYRAAATSLGYAGPLGSFSGPPRPQRSADPAGQPDQVSAFGNSRGAGGDVVPQRSPGPAAGDIAPWRERELPGTRQRCVGTPRSTKPRSPTAHSSSAHRKPVIDTHSQRRFRSRRPGDPATRRPGDPATRRPGDPATRRPGDPATRRPGDPATRRSSVVRLRSVGRDCAFPRPLALHQQG
jgi:hypothetical protein